MARSLSDKPRPGMTSSEKSNWGEEEEKEVTQWGVAQTQREFRCRLRQMDLCHTATRRWNYHFLNWLLDVMWTQQKVSSFWEAGGDFFQFWPNDFGFPWADFVPMYHVAAQKKSSRTAGGKKVRFWIARLPWDMPERLQSTEATLSIWL